MLVIQSRNMTEDTKTDEKPLTVACLVYQYTHNKNYIMSRISEFATRYQFR